MTNTLFAEHDSQFVLVNITTRRVIFCRSARLVSTEMLGKLASKWQIYIRLPHVEQWHEELPDVLSLQRRLENVIQLIHSSVVTKVLT